MNIFTIIVTYNATRWIDKCLNSLRDSSVSSIPIVVDNCSIDNTTDIITERYPEVRLLPQSQNLGFGQANNIGIQYALLHGADYVLLLNQDAWIAPDMIETLLSVSDANSLLSPIHWRGDEKAIDLRFRINAIVKGGYSNLLIDDPLLQHGPSSYVTNEINAACWLLPKRLLVEIGGFNPLFYHYAEDINYLHRLHFHKKNVIFVSGTHVIHDRKQQYGSPINNQLVYQNIILEMANIEHSVAWGLCKTIRYGLAIVHRSFADHNFNYLSIFSQSWFRAMRNWHLIQNSRSCESKIQSNWL